MLVEPTVDQDSVNQLTAKLETSGYQRTEKNTEIIKFD